MEKIVKTALEILNNPVNQKERKRIKRLYRIASWNSPAHNKSRYRMKREIEDNKYVLHKIELQAEIELYRKKIHYHWQKITEKIAGLGINLIDGNKTGVLTYKIKVKGYGLTPSIFRSLAFNLFKINKIEVSWIELKVFPTYDYFSSSSYLSMPPAKINNGSQVIYLSLQQQSYFLRLYEIKGGWGLNLELRYNSIPISEVSFDEKIYEMAGHLQSICPLRLIRDVTLVRNIATSGGLVMKPDKRPAGIILTGRKKIRNKKASDQAYQRIEALIQSQPYITLDEIKAVFSYVTGKSLDKLGHRISRKFNLERAILSSGVVAYRRSISF